MVEVSLKIVKKSPEVGIIQTHQDLIRRKSSIGFVFGPIDLDMIRRRSSIATIHDAPVQAKKARQQIEKTPNGKSHLADLIPIKEPTWFAKDGPWSWLVLAAGFFCQFVVDGVIFTFGSNKEEFGKVYSLAKTDVNNIETILMVTTFFVGPLAGLVINKAGSRVPCMLGASLSGCGLLMVAFTTSEVNLLGFAYALCAVGFGLMINSSTNAVMQYFEKRRALADGIMNSGTGFGKIFVPLILQGLELKDQLIVLASMLLSCMLLGMIMVPIKTDTIPAKKETTANDEKTNVVIVRMKHIRSRLAPLLRNIPFMILLFGQFFAFSGSVLPFSYLPDFATDTSEGIDDKMLITTIGVADTIFRITTGIVINFTNSDPLMIGSTTLVICGIGPYLMTLCKQKWTFFLTSAFFGVFNAPYAASVANAISILCGIDSLATAFGMLQFTYGLGVLMGLLLSSKLQHNRKMPFYLAAGFLVAAGLLMGIAWCFTRIYKYKTRFIKKLNEYLCV